MSVLDKQIVVAFVNPPKEGKRRGTIKTTGGEVFGVWADKIGLFHAGGTYDIEIKEQQFNGMILQNVADVRPVKSAAPVEASGEQSRTGAASSGALSMPHQSNGKDEQIFVCALLKELIRSGEIKNDKRQLWDATQMLRGLWRATFGDTSTFRASEAQQPRTVRG